MTINNQQLEKEVYEHSVNTLEAACMILDSKFGKDFHKKNPKLAVRFAETIMKNIRINNLRDTIQKGIDEYLDSIREGIQHKDSKAKETILEDYIDSFRF